MVSWDMVLIATFVRRHQLIHLNPRNNEPIAFAVLTCAMMTPTNGGTSGADLRNDDADKWR